MAQIYLSAPDVGELEAKYAEEAIASGWVAPAGPDLAAFEAEMCVRVGVAHAVALSSGTAALHLGLLVLGVRPGDVVLTPTMTFAATANPIIYVGAQPYFVDCDRLTGNVDINLLATAAQDVLDSGRRIGAIVPVDLLGKCADLTAVESLAAEFEVPVLVDAAESVGAFHHGRPSGSFGTASVFSFNGNKVMTTSGGGMLLTHDGALAERVRYLSTQARQPVVHYEHTDIGFNYRLSNVSASIGRAQLARLDDMQARRRRVRTAYRSLFAGVPGVSVFCGDDDAEDNCWLTAVIAGDDAGWQPAELMRHLAGHEIESRPLWKPLHLQPIFRDTERLVDGTSEWLFEHGLTLPSGSGMSDDDLRRVLQAIRDFVGAR